MKIDDATADFWTPVVSWTFLGTWVLLFAGGAAWWRRRRGADRARPVSKRAFGWALAAVGALFLLFAGMLSVFDARGPGGLWALAVAGPMVVLVQLLNFYGTKFCGACGRMSYQNGWPFRTYDRCPSCGRSFADPPPAP